MVQPVPGAMKSGMTSLADAGRAVISGPSTGAVAAAAALAQMRPANTAFKATKRGISFPLFFIDSAWVVLIGDHEDDDLQSLVHARVAGHGMDGARRLVENIARFQHACRLSVDSKLISPLDHIAECMMARMMVRRAGGARVPIEERGGPPPARAVRREGRHPRAWS